LALNNVILIHSDLRLLNENIRKMIAQPLKRWRYWSLCQ